MCIISKSAETDLWVYAERKEEKYRTQRLLEQVSLVIKRGRLRWFGHVEHKNDGDWVKLCMLIETEETRWTGCLRKTWWDCVMDDIKSYVPCCENAQDKEEWRVGIKRAMG